MIIYSISTIVDLLEAKNISWASYQESMPTDGFQGFKYVYEVLWRPDNLFGILWRSLASPQ